MAMFDKDAALSTQQINQDSYLIDTIMDRGENYFDDYCEANAAHDHGEDHEDFERLRAAADAAD